MDMYTDGEAYCDLGENPGADVCALLAKELSRLQAEGKSISLVDSILAADEEPDTEIAVEVGQRVKDRVLLVANADLSLAA